MPPKKKPKLTPKQELFCKEYLIDLNATKACIRAGYSEKNADKIGSQLLGKTRVSECIQKSMDKRSKKIDITADYVLGNIVEIGKRCMDEKNFREGGALKAQELLGKHLKLFTDKFEVSGDLIINYGHRKKTEEDDKK